MGGYYQLIEDADGRAMFLLRADNHEAVLRSRIFASRREALEGAAWLRRNGGDRVRFLIRQTDDGKPYFLILGADGRELARSEVCANRADADSGIVSVQRNCPAREFRGLVRLSSLTG